MINMISPSQAIVQVHPEKFYTIAGPQHYPTTTKRKGTFLVIHQSVLAIFSISEFSWHQVSKATKISLHVADRYPALPAVSITDVSSANKVILSAFILFGRSLKKRRNSSGPRMEP
ncbi:hypothetical protein HHI36_012495 [Cryptolaemus montrouzieri]|uniref:Uncharacterized protein n=1 Tax=Cryptolaemus montrouzieri TaxID=559131 RepID=A0ABD2NEL5_9CUCU